MRAAELQPGGSTEGKWLVGKAALSHDFVVKDENFCSLLSTTSLVLIGAPVVIDAHVLICSSVVSREVGCMCAIASAGQPQQSESHVVVAIGHDFNLPEPWPEACVPGKPARELFTDGPTSAALEASWREKEVFCSSLYSTGATKSETLLCSVPVPSQASGSVCLPPMYGPLVERNFL